MQQNYIENSKELVHQGNEILYDLGLFDILRKYGDVAIVGSFDLELLYRPDIDFLVKVTEYDPHRYFDICAQIAETVKPLRMKYIDQRVAQFPPEALPFTSGYFLGISQKYKGVDWSMDGWCVLPETFEERLGYHQNIKRRIASQDAGDTILRLKAELYGHKEFRSNDLYFAVLDGGVKTPADYAVWFKQKFGQEF